MIPTASSQVCLPLHWDQTNGTGELLWGFTLEEIFKEEVISTFLLCRITSTSSHSHPQACCLRAQLFLAIYACAIRGATSPESEWHTLQRSDPLLHAAMCTVMWASGCTHCIPLSVSISVLFHTHPEHELAKSSIRWLPDAVGIH